MTTDAEPLDVEMLRAFFRERGWSIHMDDREGQPLHPFEVLAANIRAALTPAQSPGLDVDLLIDIEAELLVESNKRAGFDPMYAGAYVEDHAKRIAERYDAAIKARQQPPTPETENDR